jgi:membrane protein implicated in regulation of membrane protease activity
MLFQAPGLLIEIAVLGALIEWLGMPVWAAAAVFALLVVKDFVLYPFLKVGYETTPKSGVERLIGEKGVVKQRLDPEGYVLVHGELWKARAAQSGGSFDPGTRVSIEAADGMLLMVTPLAQPVGKSGAPTDPFPNADAT